MITKDDIPQYTDNAGRCEVALPNGWKAVVRVDPDDDMPPPWEASDGHGPVSEWRVYKPRDGDRGKRPGERVLHQDGPHARFYDFAEAVRIAKRDGWGVATTQCQYVSSIGLPYEMCTADALPLERGCAAHGGKVPTPGEIAAAAAEQDFQFLRRWCNDEWHYVVVSVELQDSDGETVERDALCGVEDDTDYWREEAAEMINALAAGRVLPNEVAV